MNRKLSQRLGAAGLATATIITGLSSGEAATAVPVTTSGSTPVIIADETPVAPDVTRLIGPLAIIESATTAYGLSLDADTMRTKALTDLPAAQAASDYLSVPAVGEVGPVRGIGDKAGRCLTKASAERVVASACNGSDAQNWQWTTTTTLQGQSHALSPSIDTGRAIHPRAAGTYVNATGTASQKRPMALDASMAEDRAVSAIADVDSASKTATLSGWATSGATVEARGETTVAGDDGTWSLDVEGLEVGPNPLTVSQTLPNGVAWGSTDIVVPVEPMVATPSDGVTLDRDVATAAEVGVTSTTTWTRLDGTMTLTAPQGTTFREDQGRLDGQVKDPEGQWASSPSTDLRNGVRSDDGRSYTYDFVGSDPTFGLTDGSRVRWAPEVVVDDDAPAGSGTVDFVFAGTGSAGEFRTTGSTPTTIEKADFAADLTVTSHTSGDSFGGGLTTLRGTASSNAEVTVYWFGEAYPQHTTVATADAEGEWAAVRGLGGQAPYRLTITQPARDGVVDRIEGFTLNPPMGEPRDLTLTSHVDGDTFEATGLTTLRGTATPGATITAYWFGKDLPQHATTVNAQTDGGYELSRGMGGTKPYSVVITQTAQAEKINEVTVRLDPTPSGPADLTVTSHVDGDTFEATGVTHIHGKASSHATVTAYWFGKDYPQYATTTVANAAGDYTVSRGMGGTKAYSIVITQTEHPDTVDEISLRLDAPTP